MPRLSPLEKLRWISVLPAAVIGDFSARYSGNLGRKFILMSWGSPAGSNFPFYFQLLTYAVASATFVLAGGFIAPNHRRTTTSLLAILGTLLSLAKHILLQPHPGAANYLHFAAETVGGWGAAGMMLMRMERGLSKRGKRVDQ